MASSCRVEIATLDSIYLIDLNSTSIVVQTFTSLNYINILDLLILQAV